MDKKLEQERIEEVKNLIREQLWDICSHSVEDQDTIEEAEACKAAFEKENPDNGYLYGEVCREFDIKA